MRINLKKPPKETEKYKVEKDPIFLMTEQELEVYIDHHINDIESIKDYLKEKFKVDADELVPCVLQFLNDAKIEYTGRPFIKEIT